MSAELLREAAALMRERAEAAISASGDERWKFADLSWNDNRGTVYMVGAGPVNVADALTEEDATHIASWHPAVALAVADWLDLTVALSDTAGRYIPDAALAVARAYLGRQP